MGRHDVSRGGPPSQGDALGWKNGWAFGPRKLIVRAVLLSVLLAATATAQGAERFPPPDFTNHEMPETVLVAPRPPVMEYVDSGVLIAALAAASFFALKTRSRRWLVGLTVASLVWFGFVRDGCVCPIGAIQNVTLAAADSSYVVPVVVVIFFTLPLIVTILCGRTFCAAVCPLGAVQELALLRPVRVPRWLDQTLGLLPFVYLGLGVALAASGTAFVICRYDPFVGFFRFNAGGPMLIWGGSLLLLSMFVGRPYCRFLCPYGAILGLVARLSKWRAHVSPDECIQCRLCEDACPYGAIREPTVDQSPRERRAGRRRLIVLLLLLPVLVTLGGWLGRGLAGPFGRMDFTIRLSEHLREWEERTPNDSAEPATTVAATASERKDVPSKRTADAVEAFHNAAGKPSDCHAAADVQRQRLRVAGVAFGAWVGLVFGVKLLALSLRRRRTDHDADPAACVACGRCFKSCPKEQLRLGLIREEDLPKTDG